MERIITRVFIAIFLSIYLLSGCKKAKDSSDKSIQTGIPVTVAPVRTGNMKTYLELNATSAFMLKSIVKTPVTGYIENRLVNQGDRVKGTNCCLQSGPKRVRHSWVILPAASGLAVW